MSCNNNPIKVCSQTNIPQVDNSAIECAECGFINGQCIIIPESITYLGLPDNTNLNDFIDALMISLIDARNRLLAAEERITQLESDSGIISAIS